MNLNEKFGVLFLETCNEFRLAGYTDLSLEAGGDSYLRCNDGMTLIASQTSVSVHHLAEVLIGPDQAKDLVEKAGQHKIIWHGLRVSLVKCSPISPLHIGVRL